MPYTYISMPDYAAPEETLENKIESLRGDRPIAAALGAGAGLVAMAPLIALAKDGKGALLGAGLSALGGAATGAGLSKLEEIMTRRELQRRMKKGLRMEKQAKSFLGQDRPESVKKIYRALKRDHPEMPAGMKARIAARQGKPGKQHQGPPYKGPLTKKADVSERQGALFGGALGGAAGLAAVPYLMKKRLGIIEDATRFSRLQTLFPSTSAFLAPSSKTRKLLDSELIGQMAMQVPLVTGASGAALGSALASGSREKKASARLRFGKEKTAFLQGPPDAVMVAQQRMTEIWAQLEAMVLLYQDGHWKASGLAQNGDHELFSRLYNRCQKGLDEIAEKIHGYFGNQGFSLPAALSISQQVLQQLFASGEDHIHMGLTAEDQFQALLKHTHMELGKLGVLPLGLDDWLMSTASDFDVHSYLLQQRGAEMAQPVKVAGAIGPVNRYLDHFRNIRAIGKKPPLPMK